MGVRVAYGKKGKISAAIASGVIPKDSLIITSDSNESELYFYDVNGKLKNISERRQFGTLAEAQAWVNTYDCAGHIISVHNGSDWAPYIVTSDGVLSPLNSGSLAIGGDGKSIEIAGGIVALKGIDTATAGQQLRINADGTAIEWFTPSTNDFTEDDKEKLDGIEPGANKNLIEIIRLNGVDLDISEKAVNIPIASKTAGVVVSSDAENKVSVAEDGSMEVNNVNVNKLVQSEGDMLILDGGNAAV